MKTTFIMPDELHKRLKIYCVKTNRSMGSVINELIVSMLDKAEREKE